MGGGGETVILGEMDVARVNPYPPGQSELVHWFGISAHGLVCIPPVKDGHPTGGRLDGLSLTR